jgi:hypothetical protein
MRQIAGVVSIRTSCFRGSALPFAVAALALLLPAAQASAAPVPEACDQQDSGERLKCRFGNIVSQQRATAEMVTFMDDVPTVQKQAFMKQVERNDRSHGRAPAGDFKQLTRKSRPTCQIAEVMGDGKGDDDGVCTGNEDCVEVMGDQIGDDDGVCRPRNGRNRETCVEICDSEAVDSDPANFDDDPTGDSTGRDIEEQLIDITDQYIELNDLLEEDMQLRAAAGVLADSGDPCATVIAARANTNLFAFLVGLADGTRIGADIAERFCDQSVLGNNAAAICSIIEGIAGAAKVVATIFQFGDADIDSRTLDASYACLQSLQASVGDSNDSLDALQSQMNRMQSQMDGIEAQIGNLRAMVSQVQGQVGEVRTLVTLPLGQREGFPAGQTSASSK